VPSGLWTAVNGALRPGVEALAAHLVLVAHLVGAGALVTIAPTLCAHAGTTINMDVHYNRVMKALQTPGRKPRATARALDKAHACTMQLAAQRMSCRIRDTPRLALPPEVAPDETTAVSGRCIRDAFERSTCELNGTAG
jgi:hypothetical protein